MSLPIPRSDGRYGGKITRRRLPTNEPAVDALDGEARDFLARMWLSQAATELRVARSFAVVHAALRTLRADPGLVSIAARAVDDEHRHAALCKRMAAAYFGAEVVDPPELPFAPPAHAAATSAEERSVLHVIGQCAFNETFASGYLSASLEGAKVPLARAALSELLSDEVDHARIGWAYLATLPEGHRAAVEDWLLPLAVCNLREWRALATPRLDAVAARGQDVLAEHGFPRADVVEAALVTTLRDLVVPGLRHFGFRAEKLATWVDAGAAT